MSCFLCDSYFHVTQYCEKYISDKDRKEILLSKLNSSTKFYTFFVTKKCYICYSRIHNTIFCPERFSAPNFFIPNIDHNLLPRFLAVFDTYEKFLLACQSPSAFNADALQSLTITNTIKYNQYTTIPNIQTHAVVCKNFEFCSDLSETYWAMLWEFYDKIMRKTCAVFLENIKLSNICITSEALSLLLSTRTKIFKILHVEVLSKFTLDEIFQYAPNLEEFDFEFLRSEDYKWQNEEFFKHKYGKMFKKLKMTVTGNFDVTKKLIHFMNKGPSNIQIDVYASIISQCTDARLLFLQEVCKYFVFAEVHDKQFFSLYLQIKNPLWEVWDEHTYAGTFALKN